jgi:2-amino-4-hydroxy-6-hydroxymethyldihydropteridine diphosphokinase/dihydropteroate synthase
MQIQQLALRSVRGSRQLQSRGINGRFEATCVLALPRYYSSSIERVKATPWSVVTSDQDISTSNHPSMAEGPDTQKRWLPTAYIALGSNLGDRIGWIEKACDQMTARGIKVKRTSSLWETEPMYVLDQNNFVNGVCEVQL